MSQPCEGFSKGEHRPYPHDFSRTLLIESDTQIIRSKSTHVLGFHRFTAAANGIPEYLTVEPRFSALKTTENGNESDG
ncbi:MAG TPA: hypothetical protein DHW42_01730 [Candidatus Marinimicrobia bacterium]|nr:hypothetical protein [Candidatus Neomarinimicrobiota bacterium]